MASAPPNPNYGQTFTKGVKYIKIHKLDKNGEDFSQRLSLADNLRINYPDVGVTQYNILTTQQQGDFYLLGIIPSETTSSINEILDYRVEAITFPASQTIDSSFLTLGDIATNAGNWDIVNYNSLGYFNNNPASSYFSYYTLGNTPNTPITFTVSGSIQNSTGETVKLYLKLFDYLNIDTYLVTNSVNIPTGTNNFKVSLTLSGSLTQKEGNRISFEITADDTLTLSPAPLKAFYFLVSASFQPITSATETLVLIDPEVANFDYSDYNAILGNATSPQFSATYQNVSYDNGTLVPTNLDYIISGTAERALIQDSNYSQNSWINSRYNGTRVSSLDFNSYTKLTK
jgi:hypothetical protein